MPGRRRLEYVPLDEVLAAPVNPKRHDSGGIATSMARFGVVDVPTRDDRTGRLVSGHGRVDEWRRARDAGEDPPEGVERDGDGTWVVPWVVGWASVDDDEASAAGVAMNRLTERGGWDGLTLYQQLRRLEELDRLSGVGYSSGEIADLAAAYGKPPDLDQLAAQVGQSRPEDFWPILRIKVPPALHQRWLAATAKVDGTDVDRLAWLLDQAPAPATSG